MSTSYDDMQDILAGLLDDKTPEQPTPEQEAEAEIEAETEARGDEPFERVADALAAGMVSPDTAMKSIAAANAAEAENDDPLAALASLMDESESLSSPASGYPAEGTFVDTAETTAALASQPKIRLSQPQVHIPTFTNDEIADAIDLRNFGTLVTLQTRRWHAKVKDKQASRDAATASGADADAFDTHKRLLAGADEKLKRIHKAIDDARAKHYRMTLPWSTVSHEDNSKRTGARLLPNTLFMEYTTVMAHALQEMKNAIADFTPAYPALIQIAQTKLGTRFNAAEYPNASAISSYFDLSFDFMPIPMGGDFQGLADAQVERLADTLNRKTRQMLENAMSDAWLRLHETVTHAAERLANPDAMFHYTMVENLKEQAALLKHLNVTNDPRIEHVRTFVEKHLTLYDVKDIRKDENLRKQMAKHAKEAVALMDQA
jgi:hypothetical protein